MKAIRLLRRVVVPAALVAFFTAGAQAMELKNHTYHWYKLVGDGDHERLTSDGTSYDVWVHFACGWLCYNNWTIRPHHHASRPGKGGRFTATPSFFVPSITRFVTHLLEDQGMKAGFDVYAMAKTSCSKHVSKHQSEGIASQIVIRLEKSAGYKLYC